MDVRSWGALVLVLLLVASYKTGGYVHHIVGCRQGVSANSLRVPPGCVSKQLVSTVLCSTFTCVCQSLFLHKSAWWVVSMVCVAYVCRKVVVRG